MHVIVVTVPHAKASLSEEHASLEFNKLGLALAKDDVSRTAARVESSYAV